MYKHLPTWKREQMRRALIKRGYPSFWPELSDFIREDRNFTCEICGRKSKDVVLHHRDRNPSNLDESNLQVVCKTYNLTSKQKGGGRCVINKPYQCQRCARPLSHQGYCLACNIERTVHYG